MITFIFSLDTVNTGKYNLEVQADGLRQGTVLSCGKEDQKRFETWISGYNTALKALNNKNALLDIGTSIYVWLEEKTNRMADILRSPGSLPFFIEFCIPDSPEKDVLSFLEVPWELLAIEKTIPAAENQPEKLIRLFLSEIDTLQYSPIRRIGRKKEPPKPSEYRLSAVFMAAAPHNASPLNYEAEEIALIDAAGTKGIDLRVEESGNLALLAETVAEEGHVDVLHISCHGTNTDSPVLVFETKKGMAEKVEPRQLATELRYDIRLLFLSACLTSGPDKFFTSYSSAMISRGYASVLGWGGSVSDREATQFASHLYGFLSKNHSIETAVALSRFKMLRPEDPGKNESRDWHLARLYLGPAGGGILTSGKKKRRNRAVEYGYKEFLDKKGQVQVAGRREFVGRRRQIQAILSVFGEARKKGVLIHGIGHLGKSSLAAKISNRLPDHQVVVIFGRYDATSILNEFKDAYKNEIVNRIINTAQDFSTLLKQLLEGPCSAAEKDDAGVYVRRPALLVLDDFERLLDAPKKGENRLHTVKSEYRELMADLIHTFDTTDTDSRLIITSRFEFSLSINDRDAAKKLFLVPLSSMNEEESKKQLAAKINQMAAPDPNRAQLEKCIFLSQGNPGLANILLNMSLTQEKDCETTLNQMEAFISQGTTPDKGTIQAFLENLALDHILGLLTKGETYLLQAAAGFILPLPLEIFEILAEAIGLSSKPDPLRRLTGFGLLETFEDPVFPEKPALALNRLVRSKVTPLLEDEMKVVSEKICTPLFQYWGGKQHGNRPDPSDLQLSLLAVLTKDASILESCLSHALVTLKSSSNFKNGAGLAETAIPILDQKGIKLTPDLLNTAFELCHGAGHPDSAETYISRSIAYFEALEKQGKKIDEFVFASALLRQGRFQVQKGRMEQALLSFTRAQKVFEKLQSIRDVAIIKGDIARILANKGEVDQALKLHQENLIVCEALGDRRGKAVTLGGIARILVFKGDVDQALKLHQERMTVFDELGDRRSKAVTLGDIARILVDKGEVDQALKLHQENVIVCEELGDLDGKANTLFTMAQIDLGSGKIKEGLEKLAKSYTILLKIGRLDGISMVGMYLGGILCQSGDTENGIPVLERSRDGFGKLGWDNHKNQVQEMLNEFKGKPVT